MRTLLPNILYDAFYLPKIFLQGLDTLNGLDFTKQFGKCYPVTERQILGWGCLPLRPILRGSLECLSQFENEAEVVLLSPD